MATRRRRRERRNEVTNQNTAVNDRALRAGKKFKIITQMLRSIMFAAQRYTQKENDRQRERALLPWLEQRHAIYT
ncbi:hypothetical protein U1Q18_051723, partial [Sarracenia purpurea var. burkii]